MDIQVTSKSIEANKAIVRRYLEDVPGVLDELADPDLTIIAPGMTTMRGLKNVKMFSAPYFAALSERRFTAEEMIGEADKVTVRWTIRLTTKVPVPLPDGTLTPAGRTVTETGISICRIREGKSSWRRTRLKNCFVCANLHTLVLLSTSNFIMGCLTVHSMNCPSSPKQS